MRVQREKNRMKSHYREIIYNMDNFLTACGLARDVTTVFAIVKYMIEHHYLNKGELYTSSTLPRDIYDVDVQFFRFDETGMLLPAGAAVCRHRVNFLYYVYKSLGITSSQLFLYMPNMKINVTHPKSVSVETLQGFINEVIAQMDLESTEDYQVTEMIRDVVLTFSYRGVDKRLIDYGNHTINIVRGSDGKIHLFDMMSGRIGSKTQNSREICLHQSDGYYQKSFVREEFSLDKQFSNLEFVNGLAMLDGGECANVREDYARKRETELECLKMEKDFLEFFKKNRQHYEEIDSCVKRLILNKK